jgi:FG-GAP-like repeat
MRRRLTHLALGVLILAGTPLVSVTRAPGGLTPFVPRSLPQRAPGDFDGDGRQDLAIIQDGADGSHISIRLSGSSSTISLESRAVTIVVTDIDQDGDLDLVAVAPSGQVVAWLNDGRGRFTKQEASRSSRLSPETIVVDPLIDEPLALGATAPSVVVPRTPNGTPVAVTRVRPPAVPLAFDLVFLSLPGLRAPPLSLSLA